MKEKINYCDKKHGPMNIGCAYCEIDKLREENERFKVMYKGFENQALVIMRYRAALERIANWDKLPDDPCWGQIAREVLEEQT